MKPDGCRTREATVVKTVCKSCSCETKPGSMTTTVTRADPIGSMASQKEVQFKKNGSINIQQKLQLSKMDQ